MKNLARSFVAFLFFALAPAALAQGKCLAVVDGAVLTAAQWNACFQAKQDTGTAILGPASAANGNVAAFTGTSGKQVVDGGVAANQLVTLSGPQTLASKTLTAPKLAGATGSIQCVQADSSGTMAGSGAACRPAVPTQTVLKVVGSGTYTTPAGVRQLRIRMIGGGGGGGGVNVGSRANDGAAGTATIFGPTTANPGNGGVAYSARPGGSGGAGPASFRIAGGQGSGGGSYNPPNPTQTQLAGLIGGNGPFGGAGGGQISSDGGAAAANSGAGGGGAVYSDTGGTGNFTAWQGSGSAGEYLENIINGPAASYPYTIGNGGLGGTGAHANGGRGGSGIIIIDEVY